MINRSVFAHRHALLVVVHNLTPEQARRNAQTARDNGADGIFLIDHTGSCDLLLQSFRSVRTDHPDWWIGLNFLGLSPREAAVSLPESAHALWSDDGSSTPGPRLGDRMFFGGVAFKGQPHEADPSLAAKKAAMFMDVITTSGPVTGMAPEVDKIARMREAIGGHQMAIASGISTENVKFFLPHTDHFLVSSSISHTFTELDAGRVRRLADMIHAAA